MENGIPENPVVLPSKRKCTEDHEIEDMNKKNKPEIVNDGGEKNQNSEEKTLNGEEENHEKEEEEVNVKGKGVMISREDKGKGKLFVEDDGEEEVVVDRKGKGKMIVEDEDDSDDDDEFGGGELSDIDSDLSDDPLAEVDLDNILPSRTRRRVVPPPEEYRVDDLDDEDDSDDSDA
ncbi:histone H2A.Z-specific chaperone CHZ1-like [Papaver somniferum]|uniref:histone H2A.Z-specific chaperone CHZ1-like n=1 Tax=Papaver somniferum TaxID=3469 RepID=UPI000E703F4B|nr:histone H2A.Z-specific chaperone CHZ1-like [Papaver somniferum]